MSINKNKTANFIKNPRTIEDFENHNIIGQSKQYIIEKIIEISKQNYDNLTTDFYVDRWIIEENKNLCYIDELDIWHCILIKQKGKNDGILIQPDDSNFTKYAAFLEKVKD